MADAGSIGVYQPTAIAMPLSVWAAGSRDVTSFFSPVSLRNDLAVWAAGARLTETKIAPRWRLRLPFYVGGRLAAHLLPHQGRLSGVVTVNGEPQAGRLVGLLYRDSLRLIDSTRSDANGEFEFTELYDTGRYLVIALDVHPGEPSYNALISDYLTPVT